MKAKSFMGVLLALVMVITMVVLAPAAGAENSAATVDQQIGLLFSRIAQEKQAGQMQWYYSVTDLDHDGHLELVAAAQHPADRSTNLKVWEVSDTMDSLVEGRLNIDADESFPDILTESADTYYNKDTKTWSYMFYDNVVISDYDVYTVKCSVSMDDGVIGYVPYAVEHTQINNGIRNVSHTDANGFAISPEQFNASGVNAFASAEKSNTSFDWFVFDKASLSRLTDSYAVFTGEKKLTDVFPVPKPAALQGNPIPSPVPTKTPAPQNTKPAYLTITKNPTNENKKQGGTAYFVACSNIYDSLTWTFVGPDGGQYSVQNFARMFNASVSGEYSTTLSIANVTRDMNGWGAYCTFYYSGQTARTSTAYMYIEGTPTPKPTPKPVPAEDQSGSFSGYVTDYSYSNVSIYVMDGPGYVSQVSRSICDIDGNIYVGAPCTLYYQGIGAHGPGFYYVAIKGEAPEPEVHYGSMSGTAHEGGGGYAIYLQNGSEVFVDSWNCNVEGQFYDGCSAIVYYIDSPSTANVYRADIFGKMGLIIPDEDKGGWAGSNYPYDEMGPDPEEDQGGWAGSNYPYDEMGPDPKEDQGGWAGSNYYDNEPEPEDQGGWAGSNYYDNEPEPEDQGGWAGSNYYDNEPEPEDQGGWVESSYDSEPEPEDQGGWAGSNYYDNESDYSDDLSYDSDGGDNNLVTCPLCGTEFSMDLDECPACGWTP